MMAKIKPMPMRQHALFRRLMVLLMTALLEDMQNGTDNHTLFYEGSMAACLANGIPPEHQEAVIARWAALVQTVNIEEEKIARRGECPN